MKLGIMQPYFLPYIGYWQLINHVDSFIIYDNIQYTKKGWVNRNRYCENKYITLALKNGSAFADINKRELSRSWCDDRRKILNKASSYYKGARNYTEGFNMLQMCLPLQPGNLFNALDHSIRVIARYLDINTPIVVSSDIPADHSLRGTERVLDLCKVFSAGTYVNPIGGVDLYSKQEFWNNKVRLEFLRAKNIMYPRHDTFYPYMSIIDVIMFCKREQVISMLKEFEIL